MSDQIQLRPQEYQFLTEAILKRVEMRQQLVLAMLLAAGTFLPLGIGKDADTRILLVYPILSACLVSAWAHHGVALSIAAAYIRNCIEKNDHSIGWEGYLDRVYGRAPVFGITEFASTTALALVTQILALLYAWQKLGAEMVEKNLAVAAVLATLFTVYVSVNSARYRARQHTGSVEELCRDRVAVDGTYANS